MRVKILISALVCLLCIALTSCGFVSFVKNPDTSLEATKNEYITILRGMCDENDYSEEERREYVKLLLEVENLIREAKDHEEIVAIFKQYSLILGNIPLNIELVRARITIQMKELAAANVYREEEQRSVDWLLWYFGSTLDECEDVDRCEGILLEFKTSLANIKTDAQLYAEELATIKNELSASFGENLDYSIYRAEQKAELERIKDKLEVRSEDLKAKKEELATIVESTAKDEEKLRANREACAAKIDARTMSAYDRIRQSCNNHLAVVSLFNNDSCGGCFNTIAPQRLIDIASNRKMIICEYCGRILVNPDFE
jgi:hypothetical protein